MSSDERWMRLALRLARRGEGYVSPNPMVGAVIVKDDVLVGKGYHSRFGGPHAEIEAMRNAGTKTRRGTLYVTLEPCSHFGKTPPCTRAIIDAGISRVVIAVPDPNPINREKGIQILKDAGIAVEVGLQEERARRLNTAFFTYMNTARPHVTIKTACSLDGRIATRSGDSKWITGEAARGKGKQVRSRVDAILVGVNTVIADDPLLLPQKKRGRYTRVLLDSRLRAPLQAQVFRRQNEFPTLVFTTPGADKTRACALERKGVQVISLPAQEDGRVPIGTALTELAHREIASILVEGGGEVIASFVEGGYVDKLLLFMAGLVIGGREATSWVEGRGFNRLEQTLRFHIESIRRIGTDIVLEAIPMKPIPGTQRDGHIR